MGNNIQIPETFKLEFLLFLTPIFGEILLSSLWLLSELKRQAGKPDGGDSGRELGQVGSSGVPQGRAQIFALAPGCRTQKTAYEQEQRGLRPKFPSPSQTCTPHAYFLFFFSLSHNIKSFYKNFSCNP